MLEYEPFGLCKDYVHFGEIV